MWPNPIKACPKRVSRERFGNLWTKSKGIRRGVVRRAAMSISDRLIVPGEVCDQTHLRHHLRVERRIPSVGHSPVDAELRGGEGIPAEYFQSIGLDLSAERRGDEQKPAKKEGLHGQSPRPSEKVLRSVAHIRCSHFRS